MWGGQHAQVGRVQPSSSSPPVHAPISYPVTLPPSLLSLSVLLLRPAPDRADLAQNKGLLSPACGQCHMAGWGRGKAAGPHPGAEGAEGAEGLPLALSGQDSENRILGRQGPVPQVRA